MIIENYKMQRKLLRKIGDQNETKMPHCKKIEKRAQKYEKDFFLDKNFLFVCLSLDKWIT